MTPEQRKKWSKEYYQKNREAILRYQKEHYRKNREAILKRHREYYRKNREARLAYVKAYYANLESPPSAEQVAAAQKP